jgi:hypothetical protein
MRNCTHGSSPFVTNPLKPSVGLLIYGYYWATLRKQYRVNNLILVLLVTCYEIKLLMKGGPILSIYIVKEISKAMKY